jgi:putative hydrolase of the HAD superfamily
MPNLTTIGFDADDTLWHHERYFVATKDRFAELLAPWAPPAESARRLHDIEIANVSHYGFGVKSFTLSMIETTVAIVEDQVPAPLLAQIVELGREMLTHPVGPFPGVRETLEALRGRYKLLVITRGDLFDQERKLDASGLLPFFDEIEIVSDKTRPVYERIFSRHGDGPARSMMIGNSMRADVVPALAAGAWGIHVPSEHVWSLDLAEEPKDNPRFHRLAHVADVLPLIAEIG